MDDRLALNAWADMYVPGCKQAVTKFVEASTRFGASSMAMNEVRPMLRSVTLRVRHVLSVRSERERRTGIVRAGPGDITCGSAAGFEGAVAALTREEEGNAETAQRLATSVASSRWAAISGVTQLREHPSKVYHTYACQRCGGRGDLECHGCRGDGRVRCHACGGSMWVTCIRCGGSGTRQQVRANVGPGQNVWETVACGCTGGRQRCTCQGGWVTCGTCGGSGRVRCPDCAGTGHFTDVARLLTFTTPEFGDHYPDDTPGYVAAALRRGGLTTVGEFARVSYARTPVSRSDLVECEFETTVGFCEVSIQIQDRPSRWVVFGSPVRIHDAGGALEGLLQGDLDALEALTPEAVRRHPAYPSRASALLKPFMASELNQSLLANDRGVATPEQVAFALKSAVSESYVSASLLRLRTSVTAVSLWTRAWWMVLAAVLSMAGFTVLLVKTRVPGRCCAAWGDHLPLVGTTESWVLAPLTGLVVGALCLGLAYASYQWWLRRIGGKALSDWARARMLTWTRPTMLAFAATGVVSATLFANLAPAWLDGYGRLYGVLPVVEGVDAAIVTPGPTVPVRRAQTVVSAPPTAINPPVAQDSMTASMQDAAATPATVPAVEAPKPRAPTLDGHWSDPGNRYAVLINGKRGIITHSNSAYHQVGDIGLRVDTIYGDSLRGSFFFTNGAFYDCVGRLNGDTLSFLSAKGGDRWFLVRTEVPAEFARSAGVPRSMVLRGSGGNAVSFDGDWYSPANRYGVRISGRRGIATLVNANTYRPGDITLRIDTIVGETFSGSHLFVDGGFYPVIGRLVSRDSVELQSPRNNARWSIVRRVPNTN